MKKRYAILSTTFLIVIIFATIAVWTTHAQEKGERIYQLRIYTIKDKAGWENYKEVWRRHMLSLAKHEITTHGVWIPIGTETPYQIWALCSFPDAESVDRLDKQYRSSPEFFADMGREFPGTKGIGKGGPPKGGPPKGMGVETTLLKPLDFSPLNVY